MIRCSAFSVRRSMFLFQLDLMPQREFEITIAPDGSVEVRVKGYKGKSCLEAMKIFEQIVGEMKSQRETSEFYEPDEQVRFNIEQRH
jgi:Protein of unknown function (DUF2997)